MTFDIEIPDRTQGLYLMQCSISGVAEQGLVLSSAGPVMEEIFENERMSAFLVWGHSWPGHFLPTDRVGHWSQRDGAPGGKESMFFVNVAPTLPEVS